jgi:hypothetical protein
MSTNRRTRSWPLRAEITPEAIALFLELERAHTNPRTDPNLQDKSRRLAQLLGLLDEWFCAVCDVNDGGPTSGYPEQHLTNLSFLRVREVRKQLLAAVGARKEKSLAN